MYLSFISDEDLVTAVDKVLAVIKKANADAEKALYESVIDPFSAIFDGVFQSLSLNEWLKLERTRQIQKTMQNSIGEFHQDVLGSIKGWSNLGRGGLLDVVNIDKKIVAEVKNKYNTTKGNHKIVIYKDLFHFLYKPGNDGYVGYYVEIIPKGKKVYNKPFTPSDNEIHLRLAANERIRQIDGKSFYEIATGSKTALMDLYVVLPEIICDRLNKKFDKKVCKEYFTDLFKKVYEF
ncbi:MAG: Eco47II family restriction endonuclease [Proteobacteria bacterium]|nr:Eco47II family restriction endonuclease [Pseudomonadota bacterium]